MYISNMADIAQIFLFAAITMLYMPIQFAMSSGSGDVNLTTFFTYCGIVIGMGYMFNVSATKAACGTPQWQTAALGTILPWGLIFGVTLVVLLSFPGWLTPFACTFGYLVVRMAGVGDHGGSSAIEATFAKPSDSIEDVGKVVAEIYADQGPLLNTIPWTRSQFETFWDNIEALKSSEAKQISRDSLFDPGTISARLFKTARVRSVVATFIWYLIAGILSMSVASAYCTSQTCTMTAKQLSAEHEDFLHKEELAKRQRDANPPRVYSTYE